MTSLKKLSTKWGSTISSLLLLLLLVTSAASFECPADCECNQFSNLIKCNSLVGFKKIDKTIPIQLLDLSNLGLTKIPSQLENIRNITELNLSNNRLSEVNKLSKRIKVLNLSHNRITSGKLAKIPQFIENLNLTHNDVTYLPLYLMKLKKLKSLELAGNPINCTCDTLHVRNWLTSRHVWSDQHIKCNAPHQFKGRPWLQIKQSEVCQFTHDNMSKKATINWNDYEDDNDLMMGDEAKPDDEDTITNDELGNVDGGDDAEDDEDELKKDFLPVAEKIKAPEPVLGALTAHDHDEGSGDDGNADELISYVGSNVVALSEVEGSGAPETENETSSVVPVHVEEDYGEESGSGEDIIPYIVPSLEISKVETTTEDDDISVTEDKNESPLDPPPFVPLINIFQTEEEATTEGSGMLVAIKDTPLGSEHAINAEDVDPETTVAPEVTASDVQGTYILLAIVGIILISLIIFVACKRKPGSRNRRGKNDVENAQGRELSDMDKKLLGKPIDKNGHPEHIPLMGDREKADFAKIYNGDSTDNPNKYAPVKPERSSLEKPGLQSFKPPTKDKSHESLYENVPKNNNNVPHQNGNGLPSNGDPPGVHQNHDPNDDVFHPPAAQAPTGVKRYSPIYSPASPKSDRYSPVYSPETGRVKIKLTETPKPKTPILVNRSRSRAGEYVTTPEFNQKF